MKKALAVALCLALALCACAPQAEGLPYAPEEERRLTVYTSHKKEVWWPIVKEFEARTGIWVEVVEGGTNELLDEIAAQGQTPAADVMFGGSVENLASYAGCFEPYACADAEALDPAFCSPEELWTPFSALPLVLVYNTKLVAPGEITGWGDLLSPELRGQIAFADPAVSGSSFTALMTFFQALEGDPEELSRAFAENLAGAQLGGSGEVVAAVADGSARVGVTLEETALKRIAAGDDVALVYPAEGTSAVPDAGALVAGAPHGDNARAFLDFIAGADVQDLLVRQFYRRSVRTDGESPALTPLDEIALLDYDVAEASRRHDGALMTWAFYLDGGEAP